MTDWMAVEIPTFIRPVSTVIAPFLEAGFRLQTIDDQQWDTYEEHHPNRYRDAQEQPEILFVRVQVD